MAWWVHALSYRKQIVEDEEEEKYSTQSIRTEESLLGVTPSPTALEVYEISDISYYHIADPKEEIWISIIEEKLFSHSMQTFSSDSFILNFVQSLPVIVSENEEEFDFSFSDVVVGVQKSNTLDILE